LQSCEAPAWLAEKDAVRDAVGRCARSLGLVDVTDVEYLTDRERRLASLPLGAPTYADLRDKRRRRRRIE
jgi:hypothetical protein